MRRALLQLHCLERRAVVNRVGTSSDRCGALRQSGLSHPRSLQMATKWSEYNAKRGLFVAYTRIPRKRWLIASRARTVFPMKSNHVGPALLAEGGIRRSLARDGRPPPFDIRF